MSAYHRFPVTPTDALIGSETQKQHLSAGSQIQTFTLEIPVASKIDYVASDTNPKQMSTLAFAVATPPPERRDLDN